MPRREWDRFAKGEYERLAMEEEGGDDSEMIDAMDGWDSEDDSTTQPSDATNNGAAGGASSTASTQGGAAAANSGTAKVDGA